MDWEFHYNSVDFANKSSSIFSSKDVRFFVRMDKFCTYQGFVLFLVLMLVVLTNAEQKCHVGTGRCYWLNGGAVRTFTDARAECQSEGGDLAVMETQQLWNFVILEFG